MKHLYIILLILPLIGFSQTMFFCNNCDGDKIKIFNVDTVNKKIQHLETILRQSRRVRSKEKFEYENLVWKDYGVFNFEVFKIYDKINFRIRTWDFTNNTFTSEFHDENITKEIMKCKFTDNLEEEFERINNQHNHFNLLK